nr:M20/M25/M40 family metallo-hydrolase [Halorubrum vacuolatum]
MTTTDRIDGDDGDRDGDEIPDADRVAELGDLAADLVAIPTENPPGGESPAAGFVHEWFLETGIDAELIAEPDPDRLQVGARVGPADPAGDTVVLNGHLDVVPADDPDAWSVDPYGGIVENGRLYGRGSADMKTGLALAMLVARDLAPAIRDGDRSGAIVVHAAMGEETADPGTRTLLERGYDGDVGIVLEPTNFRVATSTKGLAVYRVTIHGEASHASQPDAGVNAIDGARAVLEAIDDYDADLRSRDDSLCGGAFATATEMEAGTGSNLAVIPDRATLVLDRRVLPGEDVAAVDAEVEALLDAVDVPGATVEATRIQTYASSEIPVDHPIATALRDRSIDAVGATGERAPDGDVAAAGPDLAAPWGMEAATDARNFVNDAGIPAVTWGPGDLDQAHTVDESIALADAAIARDVLEAVVDDWIA